MRLLKFLCCVLICSLSYSFVNASGYTRSDWITPYEKKYSVRKFDSVKFSTDCELEDKWHTFLYTEEYPDFIFFEGPVCGSLLDNFLEISTEYPEAKYLVLSSEGGLSELGLKFGQLIMKMGFYTVLPSSSSCVSACSTIFMGGLKRYAFGKLGLHRNAINCQILNDKSNTQLVSAVRLEKNLEEIQILISEVVKFLGNVPQGTPDWFLTEELDMSCSDMYYVPTDRKLELSNKIADKKIYDQLKSLQREEGSLLELAKFYFDGEENLASSSAALTTSAPEIVKLESQYTSGRVILTCGTGQSPYSLDIEGNFNKNSKEVRFKMTPSDMSDNICTVPAQGITGILRNSSIFTEMAHIEFPLSGATKSEFFWHKVFGIAHTVDLNFDFSNGTGIGENTQLSLYE